MHCYCIGANYNGCCNGICIGEVIVYALRILARGYWRCKVVELCEVVEV